MKLCLPLSRIALPLAALPVALLLGSCDGGQADSPPGADGEKPAVVTSLGIFVDFVREVGGDRVEVKGLLPSGADPHTYEPTPSQIRSISEADIIFVNDLEPSLEGSILDVIQNNKGGDAQIIPFMPNVRSPRAEELGDPKITAAEAGDNPHLWLDPVVAVTYANVIASRLASEDGANATFYNDNFARYEEKLSQLNNDISALIDEIPPENRKLVTPHDAFPHLGRRYGLEVVGFVVPGPGQDPSPQDIADLTAAVRDLDVRAVFAEPQVGADSRLLKQIAEDAGAQVCTLYSDALNDDVPTYVDMMRFNADELLRCLGDGNG